MPKKIKQEKEIKLQKEKREILNVDSIHYIFGAILAIILVICAVVGIYVAKKDAYHVHKDNPIVKFEYSEFTGDGYDVYSVVETKTKEVVTEFISMEVQESEHISRMKYLDFNEEIYNTGIIGKMKDEMYQEGEDAWSVKITLADGSQKYLYSSDPVNGEGMLDKAEISRIIKKYFNREILYK